MVIFDMKNKLYLFVIMLFLISSHVAADNLLTESSSRSGNWDVSLTGTHIHSGTVSFDNDVSASVESGTAWGMTIGYNFNENLNLAMDLSSRSADYSAEIVKEDDTRATVQGRLDTSTTNLGITYNFLDQRLTPYVTANLGWTFTDTNVPTGEPPSSGCWWYPWWGYVCGTFVPTEASNDWSYGGIVGLRFDVSNKVFAKAGAGKQWIRYGDAGNPDFAFYKFDLGLMF
jgi:opacity protein-like surface antigen